MFQQDKTKRYRRELDSWTKAMIIEPIYSAMMRGPEEAVSIAFDQVKQAIREKVLESYRNGQKAGRASGGSYGR